MSVKGSNVLMKSNRQNLNKTKAGSLLDVVVPRGLGTPRCVLFGVTPASPQPFLRSTQSGDFPNHSMSSTKVACIGLPWQRVNRGKHNSSNAEFTAELLQSALATTPSSKSWMVAMVAPAPTWRCKYLPTGNGSQMFIWSCQVARNWTPIHQNVQS